MDETEARKAEGGRKRPPRLTGRDVERMMEAEYEAEAKAHELLDALGEDAFVDALRNRGYVVEEDS